ncbi:D-2-hydroxyacid dehydrogenase [Bifidobacterium eulemuris]|uniref:2-hydroxyacid dehydrogenase n=2 Tax=Bifidobacterium eulemuris TaxID=1765219 RepID=A0A261G7F5_9BIFI|nr:D-2-hydroxyacid dehydrogenase [Bifidobacterium eulemuris]OZG67344.1 2-hydroxyacid dehydrogenase [Bifidobacterium eulemuris]
MEEQSERVIVNCLPLDEAERARFVEAAGGMRQEFVGDIAQRGDMGWRACVPEPLKARATAVIGNIAPEDCARYPRLEWLQTWSAGVDQYLADGVLGANVRLSNATGAYGQTVAEHMFAMMWSLMKNLPAYTRNQSARRWHDEGRALSPDGATVVVVGTGDIGSRFAGLAKAVGMRTIGVRRDPSRTAEHIDRMVGFDDLDTVLPQADVVAMSVPSTPQTHHLLDAHRLEMLKPTAIVLNAGRGDAIDPDALFDALCSSRLRGAGLDVTEPEPLPADSPLWNEPRCLITPHVAGGNHLAATEERIIAIALQNVRRYAAGEPLRNQVRRIA